MGELGNKTYMAGSLRLQQQDGRSAPAASGACILQARCGFPGARSFMAELWSRAHLFCRESSRIDIPQSCTQRTRGIRQANGGRGDVVGIQAKAGSQDGAGDENVGVVGI